MKLVASLERAAARSSGSWTCGPALSAERAAHLFDDVGSAARRRANSGSPSRAGSRTRWKSTLTAYAEADGSNVKCVAWTSPGARRTERAREGARRGRLARVSRGARTSPSRPRARVRANASGPWAAPCATRSSAGAAATSTSSVAAGGAAAFAAAPRGARRDARRRRRRRAEADPEGPVWRPRDRRVGGGGRAGGRPPAPRLHRERAGVRASRQARSPRPPERAEDLESKIGFAPPRPGVFLEDPLRVLRAARFLAELPGFRVARSAEAEMKRAGRFLRMVPEERRLVGAGQAARRARRRTAARALRFLERIGALQTLLQSTRAAKRGAGSPSSPASTPATPASRARCFSCRWVRREPRIFLEGGRPAGRSRGSRAGCSRWPPHRGRRAAATRRDVAELLRRCSPFIEESLLFFLPLATRARERSRTRGTAAAAPPRSAGSSSPCALFHSKKSEAPSPSRKARNSARRSRISTSPSPPARSAAPRGPAAGSRRRAGLGKRPPRLVP